MGQTAVAQKTNEALVIEPTKQPKEGGTFVFDGHVFTEAHIFAAWCNTVHVYDRLTGHALRVIVFPHTIKLIKTNCGVLAVIKTKIDSIGNRSMTKIAETDTESDVTICSVGDRLVIMGKECMYWVLHDAVTKKWSTHRTNDWAFRTLTPPTLFHGNKAVRSSTFGDICLSDGQTVRVEAPGHHVSLELYDVHNQLCVATAQMPYTLHDRIDAVMGVVHGELFWWELLHSTFSSSMVCVRRNLETKDEVHQRLSPMLCSHLVPCLVNLVVEYLAGPLAIVTERVLPTYKNGTCVTTLRLEMDVLVIRESDGGWAHVHTLNPMDLTDTKDPRTILPFDSGARHTDYSHDDKLIYYYQPGGESLFWVRESTWGIWPTPIKSVETSLDVVMHDRNQSTSLVSVWPLA